MDRIRWSSIILAILGIAFIVGGVLLIILGNSLIQKAVKKVFKRKNLFILFYFFLSKRNVN
jgi:hypothetical protein